MCVLRRQRGGLRNLPSSSTLASHRECRLEDRTHWAGGTANHIIVWRLSHLRIGQAPTGDLQRRYRNARRSAHEGCPHIRAKA